MKKKQKRLNLAVAVLRVTHLIFENANGLIDLLSKVVNYGSPHVREFQAFLSERRKANLCAQ